MHACVLVTLCNAPSNISLVQDARKGDLVRLIPSTTYSPLLKYTQHPRYYNTLLTQWIDRHAPSPLKGQLPVITVTLPIYRHCIALGRVLLQTIAQAAKTRLIDGQPPLPVARQGHAKVFLAPDQFYHAPSRPRGRGHLTALALPAGLRRGSALSRPRMAPMPADDDDNGDKCNVSVDDMLESRRSESSGHHMAARWHDRADEERHLRPRTADDGEAFEDGTDTSEMLEQPAMTVHVHPKLRVVPLPTKPSRTRPQFRHLDGSRPTTALVSPRTSSAGTTQPTLHRRASGGSSCSGGDEGEDEWMSCASSASSARVREARDGVGTEVVS